MDAARLAQTAQCLGRTEPFAVVDSGPGQFLQGRRRFARRRDRLEPWIFALRLSGSGLFRTAPAVSTSSLRTAGPGRDGAKAERAVKHRPENHARRPALRSDLTSRTETGPGRSLLFVHVAVGDGRTGNRHRLSIECLRRFRPRYLPTRGFATGIALLRGKRQSRRDAKKSG